jgi:hypothetical protein
MNTQIANNSEPLNLSTPLSRLEPSESVSHVEIFANQIFTELCDKFTHLDSLKVFQLLRTMLQEKNNCASQELDYEISTKKQLLDNFTTFKF